MSWLADLFFPPKCPFCSAAVTKKIAVCPKCENEKISHGIKRKVFLKSGIIADCLAPYVYDDIINAMHRFKFGGNVSAARGFAIKMADEVRKSGFSAQCVTYVPMHRVQKRERGYNQAELLAKELSLQLQIPCVKMLEKKKETKMQHKLTSAERKKNLKGAFAVKVPDDVKSVLLCDDIITTGTTMQICMNELCKGGIEKIMGITVASTEK